MSMTSEPISMYENYFKDLRREPVLVDYVMRPIDKKDGTIVRNRGDDLIVHCYKTLLKRNDFVPEMIGDSIVSCNSQIVKLENVPLILEGLRF